jgi:hypothetical protein
MSEKADFEPSLKRASHFVKIIVACPHHLPKLPESTLRKQARPNNGSLFYSHCATHPTQPIHAPPPLPSPQPLWVMNMDHCVLEKHNNNVLDSFLGLSIRLHGQNSHLKKIIFYQK